MIQLFFTISCSDTNFYAVGMDEKGLNFLNENVGVSYEEKIGGKMKTRWNHYLAYFFGGAFLANAMPHFINGIMGHPFQSPFASPPGQGLSSAIVNVLWGALNFIIAYLLIGRVGTFELRRTKHMIVAGLGALLMAVMLARTFGRFYNGL